jgi:hypothetical protein
MNAGPIRIHDQDVVDAGVGVGVAASAVERDLLSVRRPGRVLVVTGMRCDRP